MEKHYFVFCNSSKGNCDCGLPRTDEVHIKDAAKPSYESLERALAEKDAEIAKYLAVIQCSNATAKRRGEQNAALQQQVGRMQAQLDAKWSSVDERLPEDGQVVIVHGGIAFRQNNVWRTLTGEAYPGRIIQWVVKHWRPLPSPPDAALEGK